MIDPAKRAALESAGFIIGDAKDFLELTEDERREVERRTQEHQKGGHLNCSIRTVDMTWWPFWKRFSFIAWHIFRHPLTTLIIRLTSEESTKSPKASVDPSLPIRKERSRTMSTSSKKTTGFVAMATAKEPIIVTNQDDSPILIPQGTKGVLVEYRKRQESPKMLPAMIVIAWQQAFSLIPNEDGHISKLTDTKTALALYSPFNLFWEAIALDDGSEP